MSHFTIIGLGTNLGNRERYLRQAVVLLSTVIDDIKESAVYASPAMLPEDAPQEWNIPFLNMAICGKTALSPRELLAEVCRAEEDIGRKRIAHWGPREIDLDILAYDQEVLDDEALHIPHPGMLTRPFVWMPVRDIAPDWIYPRDCQHQGRTIREITDERLADTQGCTLFKKRLPEFAP